MKRTDFGTFHDATHVIFGHDTTLEQEASLDFCVYLQCPSNGVTSWPITECGHSGLIQVFDQRVGLHGSARVLLAQSQSDLADIQTFKTAKKEMAIQVSARMVRIALSRTTRGTWHCGVES